MDRGDDGILPPPSAGDRPEPVKRADKLVAALTALAAGEDEDKTLKCLTLLTAHLSRGWRRDFGRVLAQKYNSFFLKGLSDNLLGEVRGVGAESLREEERRLVERIEELKAELVISD
mmetsp:Transcript_6762/g.13111  ORF Transcript_6762/g.13111 Transcript_6762/m.13111 type:complete len:117 (-) Transcript_6762:37-387(-)